VLGCDAAFTIPKGSLASRVHLRPAFAPSAKGRVSVLKAFAKPFFVGIPVISALILAGCDTKGIQPTTYTISGTVVHLAGTAGGLVLQDNVKDTLPVNANGTFTFAATVASGDPYNVSILTQPSDPAQICAVTNGVGIATSDVTKVVVNCGHNEWAWMKGPNTVSNNGVYGALDVAAINNNPGGRQAPATWTDASGNLWLFGGYGFDSATQSYVLMNDLWKYGGGEWTWMSGPNLGGANGTYGILGVPSALNAPGARYQATSWTDSSGNLWLFGGIGNDSSGTNGTLNDLWKYSGGEWTWMGGSDLADQPGAYGTLDVAAASNIPSTRSGALSWTDSSGDFWLFGGFHRDSSDANGMLNDLWKYSNGQWTWESGSKLVNQKGLYGEQGVSAPENIPGARNWAVGWTDSAGNLWLFGGVGYDGAGSNGLLNDLWKYSNDQWTWVSGSTANTQNGMYGTQGTAGGNSPGSRQLAVSWTDSSGNFWLFGGNGMDSVGAEGLLNDLWKYSNGQWTWTSGSKLINQNGVYGIQGTLAPGNVPGVRYFAAPWVDPNGNLWLFGGYGAPAAGTEGNLNDLWMYLP